MRDDALAFPYGALSQFPNVCQNQNIGSQRFLLGYLTQLRLGKRDALCLCYFVQYKQNHPQLLVPADTIKLWLDSRRNYLTFALSHIKVK